MRIGRGFSLAIVAWTMAAHAAPDQSLRPMARPAVAAPLEDVSDIVAAVEAALTTPAAPAGAMAFVAPNLPAVRPMMRPVPEDTAVVIDPELALETAYSLRPVSRPDAIVEKVLFGKRKKKKGSVCGDIDIQGSSVGGYGKGGGCYIPDAVRVTSVSDVKLSQSALMTCETAKALNTWVRKGVQPAFNKRVVELKVAAHYSCRTRNNKPGAKLSEHAKGRAIDISAFVLKNGQSVTVLKDWSRGRYSKALKKAHKSACGPFGTVLGPKSDRYHQDHFHMDTARYRSGTYCR